MRVVLLNTYETGGAARACFRLFQGLKSTGADVSMIVRSNDHLPEIISAGRQSVGFLQALIDGLLLYRYPNHQRNNFSPAIVPGRGIRSALGLSPDLVHLHWIPQGFVHVSSLKNISCPVVWTFHDSWPFTGGCHMPGECSRFERSCGKCPVLGSDQENDWSRRIWINKMDAWRDVRLVGVAPSNWLAEKARASSLFSGRHIEVIPNGIDIDRYTPGDRMEARRQLGLPENRHLILYGANHAFSDANKGLDLLLAALHHLSLKSRQNTELIIFGEDFDCSASDCILPVRNLGEIKNEEQMVLLYRAGDIFVAPSRQENLPNMVMESMACGTPCAAFSIGGIPDLISHGESGYLAQAYVVEDLARGLDLMLSNELKRYTMAVCARGRVAENMNLKLVAERYMKLYANLHLTNRFHISSDVFENRL